MHINFAIRVTSWKLMSTQGCLTPKFLVPLEKKKENLDAYLSLWFVCREFPSLVAFVVPEHENQRKFWSSKICFSSAELHINRLCFHLPGFLLHNNTHPVKQGWGVGRLSAELNVCSSALPEMAVFFLFKKIKEVVKIIIAFLCEYLVPGREMQRTVVKR